MKGGDKMSYPFKANMRVLFRTGRSPTIKGKIIGSGKNLVWVKPLEVEGKKVSKKQQTIMCISRWDVIVKEEDVWKL